MVLGEQPTTRRAGFAATRDAILGAARDIMRTDGVGALNLNEVARRVGMKTPSLYTYFESKHALCDALFLLGMREYRREFLDLLADREVDGTLIEDVIAHYMAFADANPDLYALVFERPVPGFVPSEESLQEAAALLEDGLSQFEAALASGAIRSGLDAAQTRDLFIAVAHGLTALKRANEPDAADGTGRFAPLVPAAAALLQAAWQIPGDRSQQNKGDQQ